MRDFGTEGLFCGFDLNEGMPSNKKIIGDLHGETRTAASASSLEVDETNNVDPVPDDEEKRQADLVEQEEQVEKSVESSSSPSKKAKSPTPTERLEYEEPETESPSFAFPLIPFVLTAGPPVETEAEPVFDLSLSFAPRQVQTSATTTSTVVAPPSNALQSVLTAMIMFCQTLSTHIVKVDMGMAEMRSDISTLFDTVKKREEKKKAEEVASESRKRKWEEEKLKKKEKKRKKAEEEASRTEKSASASAPKEKKGKEKK